MQEAMGNIMYDSAQSSINDALQIMMQNKPSLEAQYMDNIGNKTRIVFIR
jgi:hypothetical protein